MRFRAGLAVSGPQAQGARRTQAGSHGGSRRGVGAEHTGPGRLHKRHFILAGRPARHRPNQPGTPPRRGSGLWSRRCSSSTWSRRSSSVGRPPDCFPLGNRSGNVKVCPCACGQNRRAQPGTLAGRSGGRWSCLPHACRTDARPEDRYAGWASAFSSRSHCCDRPLLTEAGSSLAEPSEAPLPAGAARPD